MRLLLLAVCSLLVAAPMGASAQSRAGFNFERDCAKWIEQHGYSTDYIKQKTGKRQRGTASYWRANVETRDVQPGDVVITYIARKGESMRVAYVEDVRRDAEGKVRAVLVTEWNRGTFIDEPCLVTDHFGRLSDSKPMMLGEIEKVWRPSLPLPGAAGTADLPRE